MGFVFGMWAMYDEDQTDGEVIEYFCEHHGVRPQIIERGHPTPQGPVTIAGPLVIGTQMCCGETFIVGDVFTTKINDL